jgi:hypothetical protein
MGDYGTKGFGLAALLCIVLVIASFAKHQYAAGTTALAGLIALVAITVWLYRRDQRRKGFRQ